MSLGANTNIFVVEAPGPLPAAWNEIPAHIEVEESSSLSAVAQLRYLDPDRTLLQDTGIRIGTPLTVKVKPGDETTVVPLFTGEVVALEAEYDGQGSFTTLRAVDLSHRLHRGRRIAGFVGQTASDIAAAVASRAGIPVGRIDPTSTTYPLRTQPNVTDWEFLAALAEENNREIVVDDGKFHFRAPGSASGAPGPSAKAAQSPHVIELGENVLSVRSSMTSVNQVGKVLVHGWDVNRKRHLVAERHVHPGTEVVAGLDSPQAIAPFGPTELLVTDVPYRTDAEVQAVATAVAAELAASVGELEIVARGNPHLRVGTPIALTGAGGPFDGKYSVTATRHSDQPGVGYETCVTVSGRQDRTLFGLAAGACAPARSPRIPGVAVGVVTDIQAPADLRGQGWVRLKFPWLSDVCEDGAAYVSDWVRTVQLGGADGGGVFSPEVDDEVLVAFEQGHLDRPYAIGGLYNGVDRPSPHDVDLVDEATGKLNRRSFASRSGHRIELLDAASGPAGIRLSTGSGTGKDAGVGRKSPLVVHLDDHKTQITVHSDGTVAITADREVTVTGRGITLDAGQGDLTLTGNSVSVSGRTGLHLDGGTQCTMQAAAVSIAESPPPAPPERRTHG